MRQDNKVLDAAVLITVGVNPNGKRDALGVSVTTRDHEIHWRTFLQSLIQCRLCDVELIISDAHVGLKEARHAIFVVCLGNDVSSI